MHALGDLECGNTFNDLDRTGELTVTVLLKIGLSPEQP